MMRKSIPIVLAFGVMLSTAACTKRSLERDLIGAAATGNVPEIKKLISRGANVNCTDGSLALATPLIWAAYEGQAEAVQALLDAGADPNIRDKPGKSALFIALRPGDQSSIITALILAGAHTEEHMPFVANLEQNDPNRLAFERAIRTVEALEAKSKANSNSNPALLRNTHTN